MRKPISVATVITVDRDEMPIVVTTIVCDDGTIWRMWGDDTDTGWWPLASIPSDR